MSTRNHSKLKLALIGTGGVAGAHVQGMPAHTDKVERS